MTELLKKSLAVELFQRHRRHAERSSFNCEATNSNTFFVIEE